MKKYCAFAAFMLCLRYNSDKKLLQIVAKTLELCYTVCATQVNNVLFVGEVFLFLVKTHSLKLTFSYGLQTCVAQAELCVFRCV